MTHAGSTPLVLTPVEQQMLAGAQGRGVAAAMRLVTQLARVMGAERLLPITGAHIDSCLYHGQASLDFVALMTQDDAAVAVTTTLNVSSLDLLHPDLYVGDADTGANAKQLMDAYVSLGCEATWTCAPYQEQQRPGLGENVAWAESNAIVFANSVLGARTHRYGDFIDIAAAITGRVPDAGLHRREHRAATIVIDVTGLPRALLASDTLFPLLGLVVGSHAGQQIPAIVGLPGTTTEDQLKALGASAASSGSLAMFHAVGVTPEAPTLEAACAGQTPGEQLTVAVTDLAEARAQLAGSAIVGAPVRTISLGTPHYSITEIGKLVEALGDRGIHPDVAFYVSTSRAVLTEAKLRGWAQHLEVNGIVFVTDTCTYITPILRDTTGLALTDSAKWAYYAPGNIGVDSVLATLHECVESAVTGTVVRHQEWWAHE